MEFYVPETEFKKADFKGVSKRDDANQVIEQKRSDSKNSSRKNTGEQINNKTETFDQPKTVEYKIRNKNEGSNSLSTTPISKTSNNTNKIQVTTKKQLHDPNLTPRQVRSLEIKRAHAPDGWKPQTMTKMQAEKSRQNVKKNQASEHLPAPKHGLLAQTVLANLENSRHVLRNWLWEKKGMGNSKLAYIESKDRIYLALRLMGMEVLQVLFKTMSPKEREQFVNILKSPQNVPENYAGVVQTEFISQVMNQSYY